MNDQRIDEERRMLRTAAVGSIVQDLEQQLADLQQEAKLNASMLAQQTDFAREAEVKLADQTAALGALTAILRKIRLFLISCCQASQTLEDAITKPNEALGGIVLLDEVDKAL